MQINTNRYKHSSKIFCSICSTWIQNDSKSIKAHENGGRHRFNLRKESQENEKSELKAKKRHLFLQNELATINRAALRAVGQVDISSDRILRSSFEPLQFDEDNDEASESLNTITVVPNQVLGQYFVDNKVYLEGNMHEDLLSIGRHCQAVMLIDSTDNETDQVDVWCDCTILSIKKKSMLNTHKTYRKFAVVFDENSLISKNSNALKLIPSRDLRIPAPGPPSATNHNELKRQKESQSYHQTAVVEEEGWTTISSWRLENNEFPLEDVKMGDSETGELSNADIFEREPEILNAKNKRFSELNYQLEDMSNFEYAMHQNDAFLTLNPFGGDYKGVKVDEKTVKERVDLNMAQDDNLRLPRKSESTREKVIKFKKKRKR